MANFLGSERETIIDALRKAAQTRPDDEALRSLVTGDVDGPQEHLDFRALDQRARAIGARLQAADAAGERVLVLYPNSVESLAGFLGCLYAGAIAVPAPRPTAASLARRLERTRALVGDASPRFVLCSPDVARLEQSACDHAPELAQLTWIETASLDLGWAEQWHRPDADGSTLAYLQYSSGSTRSPRGCMITHENLAANCRMLDRAFGAPTATMLVWMPLFHDMGLVSSLASIFSGGRTILLRPESFAQRPRRWLEAIGHFAVDRSGAPNFAFDLCVDQIPEAAREGLDLASWRTAYNGAEPVQAATLRRFAEAFAPWGLRADALAPCYGLAEATVLVSMAPRPRVAQTIGVDRADLERGTVSKASDVDSEVELVGCGPCLLDEEVAIVDPETRRVCRPGRIGEIWVTGSHIAAGYFGHAEESRETFGARLSGARRGDARRWLRTGDLGFVHAGEIYPTGRIKDVIIIRGRNLYPHDIERTVAAVDADVRAFGVAACSVSRDGRETFAVVAELTPRAVTRLTPTDGAGSDVPATDALGELCQRIFRAVAVEFEAEPSRVMLVRPGGLPRTTSGKIQRTQTRLCLEADTLSPVYDWYPPRVTDVLADVAPRLAAEADNGGDLAGLMVELLGGLVGQDVPIDVGTRLESLGVDSLRVLMLRSALEDALDLSLPARELFDLWHEATVGELAGILADRWLDRWLRARLAEAGRPTSGEPHTPAGAELVL